MAHLLHFSSITLVCNKTPTRARKRDREQNTGGAHKYLRFGGGFTRVQLRLALPEDLGRLDEVLLLLPDVEHEFTLATTLPDSCGLFIVQLVAKSVGVVVVVVVGTQTPAKIRK